MKSWATTVERDCQWSRLLPTNVRLVRAPLPIESLVSEITGERHPAFALSLGTPGRFRKATVRVMNHEGRVVGYIKLPMTAEAVARVRHETTALDYLATFSSLRAHIPRVLFAGKWGKRYILFQSPGPSRAVPAEFAPVQQMFLQNLRGVDGVHRQGNSLVEEVGARWQKTEEGFDSRWRALGRTVLMTASRELGNLHIRCGITHGDFAPWNSRISEDGLFVFDWESAERQTPYLWDVFHFEVQVASLLHGTKHPHRVLDRDSGERALYLLYLLKSACQAFDETQVANHPAIVYRFRALTEELCA